MINLKFKNANTMAYSIVEIENKKYIMDLGSMKGKRYFLGLMPNLITLDMIELTPSDDSFEIKSKTKIGTTTISIMVQPFVALLYRAMESAFISMGLSQQIFTKSILFVLSMLLAYLGAVYYEKILDVTHYQKYQRKANVIESNLNQMVKEILYYCSAFY